MVLYSKDTICIVLKRHLIKSDSKAFFDCEISENARKFLRIESIKGLSLTQGLIIDAKNIDSEDPILVTLSCGILGMESIPRINFKFSVRTGQPPVPGQPINVYGADKLLRVIWPVKPDSVFKIPIDSKNLFRDMTYGSSELLRQQFTEEKMDPQNLTRKEVQLKPRMATLTYRDPKIDLHDYFILIKRKERAVKKLLILDSHVLIHSIRLLNNNVKMNQLTLFKVERPDLLFDDESTRLQADIFGNQTLSINLHDWDKVHLTQISKSSFAAYCFSKKTNSTLFKFVDTAKSYFVETYSFSNWNLSNCISIERTMQTPISAIVDCFGWNPSENAKAFLVGLRVTFNPFIVRIRGSRDLQKNPWHPNLFFPDIHLLKIHNKLLDRQNEEINIFAYSPSQNLSIVGIFYLQIFAGSDLSDLTPKLTMMQSGYFDTYCYIDNQVIFWINTNIISVGSNIMEKVIYFTNNDPDSELELVFNYCNQQERELIMIVNHYNLSDNSAKDQIIPKTFFMSFDGLGKLNSPGRTSYFAQLVTREYSVAAAMISSQDNKASFLYSVDLTQSNATTDSITESSVKLRVHKVRYDYPLIRILGGSDDGISTNQAHPTVSSLRLFGSNQQIRYFLQKPSPITYSAIERSFLYPEDTPLDFFGLMKGEGSIVSVLPPYCADLNKSQEERVKWMQSISVHARAFLSLNDGDTSGKAPRLMAMHAGMIYILNLKSATLHVVNTSTIKPQPHPADDSPLEGLSQTAQVVSHQITEGSGCMASENPAFRVEEYNGDVYLLISNSGFKRKYEDIIYCSFRVTTQGVSYVPSNVRSHGQYMLRPKKIDTNIFFCYYNEDLIQLKQILPIHHLGRLRFDEKSVIDDYDTDPLGGQWPDFHGVDLWQDPSDGTLFMLICRSFRGSIILPFKRALNENDKSLFFIPQFDRLTKLNINDRLVGAECKPMIHGKTFEVECVVVSQNLAIHHLRYIRVNDDSKVSKSTNMMRLVKYLEYELPSHGILDKLFVGSRHVVVAYKEEKMTHIVVFEKWRKWSLQVMTLSFETEELYTFFVDGWSNPSELMDRMAILNSNKILTIYNISNPMVIIKSDKQNRFNFQPAETLNVLNKLKIKGLETNYTSSLEFQNFNVIKYWHIFFLLLGLLAMSIVCLAMFKILYYTKTKNKFLDDDPNLDEREPGTFDFSIDLGRG